MKKLFTFCTLFLLAFSTLFAADNPVWTLKWNEDFTESSINTYAWNVETVSAGAYNHELQAYTESAVSLGTNPLDNKKCLILTATKVSNNSITSGRVNSNTKFQFQYGKIEARIWFPKTAGGLWPAFWMMGTDVGQWPACGETDIIELGEKYGIANGIEEYYFNGSQHWGANNSVHKQQYSPTTNPYSVEDGFHLFTCIWTPTSVDMYVDLDQNPSAAPYYRRDITKSTNNTEAGYYFHTPNHILFNLAVGGDFPGMTQISQVTALNNGPQKMYVDWVRVYQRGETNESITIPAGAETDAIEATPATYTITFKDAAGATLQTSTVDQGTVPVYTGATPTKASDATYAYEFSGWGVGFGPASANTTYTAQFKTVKHDNSADKFENDFESYATGTAASTIYNVMEAGTTSCEVVANPDKGGLNCSNNVLQLSRAAGSSNWGGIIKNSYTRPAGADGMNYVHVLVYRNNTHACNLKVENTPSGGKPVNIDPIYPSTIKAGEWQDYVFDITGYTLNFLMFMVDMETTTEETVVWIDDIAFSSSSTPRTDSNGNCNGDDIVIETCEPKLQTWDNVEATAAVIDNPYKEGLNLSKKVIAITRTAGTAGTEHYGGIAHLATRVTGHKYLHAFVRHYDAVLPFVKVEDNPTNGISNIAPIAPVSMTANVWTDVVWDITGYNVDFVYIMIRSINAGTMYVDDIVINDDPAPRTTPSEAGDDSMMAQKTVMFDNFDPMKFVWDNVQAVDHTVSSELVENPFLNGANTSASHVLHVSKTADAAAWAGIAAKASLSDEAKALRYVHVLMYSTVMSSTNYPRLKINDNFNDDPELPAEVAPMNLSTLVPNTWVDLVYDLQPAFDKGVTNEEVVLMISQNVEAADMWIDEVMFSDSETPRTSATGMTSDQPARILWFVDGVVTIEEHALGDILSYQPNPTTDCSDYTFACWTRDKDGARVNQWGNSVLLDTSKPDYTITKTEYFYALFVKNSVDTVVHPDCEHSTWTVSFDATGGTTVAPIKNVANGTTITAPPSPTKTGSDFVEWCKDFERLHPWNFATDVVRENITLYAKWQAVTYAITYSKGNTSGATGADVVVSKTRDFDFTLAGAGQFTRTGYTQTGWSVNPNGSTKDYELGGTYTANEIITLYPYWTANAVTRYTITYLPGTGGTGTIPAGVKEQNVDFTLSSATFSRVGYTQVGWATTNGGTQAYALGGTYTANAAITLYPVWSNTYTITYAPGGYGSGSIGAGVKTHGVNFTLTNSTYTRTDCSQTGWTTTDGGTKVYELGGTYTRNANIVLYPTWSCTGATHVIRYNCDGATSGCPAEEASAAALPDPIPTPSKTGYSFAGWYTNPEKTVAAVPGAAIDADITLYAKWTPSTFTVSYNPGTGAVISGSRGADTKVYDVPLQLPGETFFRSDYCHQIGWATSDRGSKVYELKQLYKNEADITLYPVWSSSPSPVVIVESDKNLTTALSSVASGDYPITTVIVRPGVTLTVDANLTTLKTLILEGGWNADKTAYAVPHLQVESGVSFAVNNAFYDLSIDKAHYYSFAVPCDVRVSEIDYRDYATASVYGRHYQIRRYSGTKRTVFGHGNLNWDDVAASETLHSGEGYIITAVPIGDRATIRIPLTLTYIDKRIPVTAHAAAETVNVGWNFIGLPYMGNNIKLTYSEQIRHPLEHLYINVPSTDFNSYTQTDIETLSPQLEPFTGVFIQVGSSGYMTCSTTSGSLPIYAPQRTAAADEELKIALTLRHGTVSDLTTLYVRDDYSTDYEIGADLQKLLGSASMATYTIGDNQQLCYNALPRYATTNIPVGYRAAASGEYVYAVGEVSDEVESVLLYDSQLGQTCDLKQSPYTFTTTGGQNDQRFSLSLTYRLPGVVTSTSNVADTQTATKMVLDNHVCIVRDGHIYTVLGVCVR